MFFLTREMFHDDWLKITPSELMSTWPVTSLSFPVADNYILLLSSWRCLCLELQQKSEAFPVRSDCLRLHHRPGRGLGPRGLWEPRLLLDLHLWQTAVELCWPHCHCHTGTSRRSGEACIFAFAQSQRFNPNEPQGIICRTFMSFMFLLPDQWGDLHDCGQDFLQSLSEGNQETSCYVSTSC